MSSPAALQSAFPLPPSAQTPEGYAAWAAEDNAVTLRYVTGILFPLATFIVALRLYARRVASLGLWWDDYVIIVSWLLSVALSLQGFWLPYIGFGHHISVIITTTYFQLRKAQYILMNFYYPQLTATKVSVLLMYRRIFPVQPILKVGWKKSTWYTRGWWFILFMVVGYGISFFFTYMFYTTPIASAWTPGFPRAEQHVISANYVWSGAALNMFNDVLILSLPVGNIVRLKLPLNQRLLLVFIFMLGSFVTMTSAARLYFSALYLINIDGSFVATTSYVWTQTECFTGLICACLPVLGPIVAKSMGRSIFTPKSSQKSSPVSTLRREPSFISEKLRSPDSPDYPRSVRSHSRLRPDTEKDLEAGRSSYETGNSRHTSTSTYDRTVPQMPKMSFENTQAPPLPKLKSGQGKPVARAPAFREGDEEVMDTGVLAGPDPPHDPRHEEHMSPTPWREPNSFDLERQTEYQQNLRVAQMMASRGQDENRQSVA